MANKITKIWARQVLDSRGNPTVEAEVASGDIMARASVPSGASTGSKEALELRDGDRSLYGGKSVLKAVDNIRDKIAVALSGLDPTEQRTIDQRMIELDGTENKRVLGANGILAVSLATARLGAKLRGKPLYRYLFEDLKAPNGPRALVLPTPLMNIVNGGQHASNNLDIQEFMILPHIKKSFSHNLRAGVETFHALRALLTEGGHTTAVGDEGGFAPNLENHRQAIELILKAIEKAGYRPGEDISLSLDAAANEFCKDGHYHMEGKEFDANGMIDYYDELCRDYPIYSIEDGLSEDDQGGWSEMTKKLGSKVVLVGDDLFVTNKAIFLQGIEGGLANAILIKVNQIGSLSETLETVALGLEHNYKIIVSHRSGETGDAFIGDLAVGLGCGHIKTGSASRSDRLEKYNQLLRIEEELSPHAHFFPVK